jgi:hypothetical protein
MFVDLAYLQLDDSAFNDEIATKIRLMRSTLLTLGGLQPWMRIFVRTMLMCLKVRPPGPWIKPLVCLHEPMAKIIANRGEGVSIELCDKKIEPFVWLE